MNLQCIAKTSTRDLRRVLLALLLAVSATLGLGAPSASAYTPYTISGRPGAVVPYQVVGTHFPVACGAYAYVNCFQPGLIIYGPYVYRSPATSGAQIVTVNTTVYRWSNGWYAQTQRTQQLTIPAGYSGTRFSTWNVLPNTGGAKYVAFAIVWANAYGQPIATQGIAMNTAGDYVCQTRLTTKCTAYPGFVTVVQ